LKDSRLNPSEITKELLKGMSLSQLEAFMKSNLKKITDNHFQSDLVKESYR
jgi:hypothetical protein